jgi:3',5'-cyclic AMP phosphodiesterase CpdA
MILAMSTFRIIQFSDTHLSRTMPWCVAIFEAKARIIAARSPDLLVNTGDIAFNGADLEDDLATRESAIRWSTFLSAPCPETTTSATILGSPTPSSRSPTCDSNAIDGRTSSGPFWSGRRPQPGPGRWRSSYTSHCFNEHAAEADVNQR